MPLARIGDVKLFYEWLGPEGGPAGATGAADYATGVRTVVLVNGLLTDTSSWRPTIAALSPKYRVLAYDCRGQGKSDKPTPPDGGGYPPRLHARDLGGLLDHLAVGRAHFIGLSSGGCVALQLAADRPEWFRSIIVASAYARVDAALRAKLRSWVSAMEAGGAPLRFDVATPYVWGETHLDRNYEALKPFRDTALGISLEPAMNLIRGGMDHDILDRLPEIRVPVLVVTGDEDILTTPKHWRQLLTGLPAAEHATMRNAGHATLLEQPEAFNRLALDFLARVDGG